MNKKDRLLSFIDYDFIEGIIPLNTFSLSIVDVVFISDFGIFKAHEHVETLEIDFEDGVISEWSKIGQKKRTQKFALSPTE